MLVSISVPPDWLWTILLGGYKAMGTELNLSNAHLHKEGIVKEDGESRPLQSPVGARVPTVDVDTSRQWVW